MAASIYMGAEDKSHGERNDIPGGQATPIPEENHNSDMAVGNQTDDAPENGTAQMGTDGLINVTQNQTDEPSESPVDMGESIILYWGDGCPHCETVKVYIASNGVDSKLNIEQREVYYNAENQLAIQEAAKECGINPNQLGVPMLYHNGSCYVGDQDAINFLNHKLAEVA